jgi:hypothetical protein
MRSKLLVVLLTLSVCPALLAQNTWTWRARGEVRANYRWSDDEKFAPKFPFPPSFIPEGQDKVYEQTPDPGHHAELQTAELQLDLGYSDMFAAHVKAHVQGLYRRNPTSSDRNFDAEELYVRFGRKPEFLERPVGTSFFLLLGKAPKMERQPTRLLESYGVAATAFNRFEDVQALLGGTVGRSFYWRLQAANGNPLFFRDPNALAGDNGTPELREPNPSPKYGSGFPILYNAETEGYFFNSDHLQTGEALGYRWQRVDQSAGIDIIAFHYQRSMADRADLTGTFYGGDIDLLDLVAPAFPGSGLPINGRKKEEFGSRLYSEWHGGTLIAQFTKQSVAGLHREGWEIETGYKFSTPFGVLRWIQPAVRASGITNRFRGDPLKYPAPSVWWQWTKFDGGVRIGLTHNVDVTAEYTKHNVGAPKKLSLRESLVTVRWRI